MINVGRRSCLCSWPGRQLTHFELLPNWDGQDLAYAPHQLPLAERFIAATDYMYEQVGLETDDCRLNFNSGGAAEGYSGPAEE